MDPTSVGLVLPRTGDRPRSPALERAVDAAARAERLGYGSVWTTEGWGTDSFVQLAEIAHYTDTIGLGTSIVNVFSRTPAALAMASATLQRASEGRFVLGLGTGHPGTIEDIHGLPWRRPVRRTHETIELVKRFTAAGEPFTYEGEVFEGVGADPLDVDVPVYNAALGEANRRATGRLADGWLPYNIPLPAIEGAFETVADAAREAGRDPDDIEVTPWVPAAVSDDPGEALELLRGTLARYIGGFRDDAYKNAVAQRFPDAAGTVAELWRAGDRDAAREAVTDEMVHALGIAGTPRTARDRLEELIGTTTIDTAIVSVPTAADGRVVERTVESLAPDGAP